MFDKKQKCCLKRIHLVTDDDLYDQIAFYEVKKVFFKNEWMGMMEMNELWGIYQLL